MGVDPNGTSAISEPSVITEAPTPPPYVAQVDPRHVDVYKQVVLPASNKQVGVSMRTAAERIYEHSPDMLAMITGRKAYKPGGCGIPHDIRREIAKIHAVAYPNSSQYRDFGDAEVRAVYTSPRIRVITKKRCGRFAYARGWAVCGFK